MHESCVLAARLQRSQVWDMFASTASEWRHPVVMSNVGTWLRSRSMAAFGFSRSPGWHCVVEMPRRPCGYTKILASPAN